MTRALVVSDSHGYAAGLRMIAEDARRRFGALDACLHCGDGAGDVKAVEAFLRAHDPKILIWQVRGNCDSTGLWDVPVDRVVSLGGAQIYMTHGHFVAVKSTLTVLEDDTLEHECSIGLFGHTHEPCMEVRRALLLNPGCAHMGQYLVLEIENGKPVGIHLEQLKF